MAQTAFEHLQAEIAALGSARSLGRVVQTGAGTLEVVGLSSRAALGDRVRLLLPDGRRIGGEVLALRAGGVTILADGAAEGVTIGARVELLGPVGIAPDDSWKGRIVDAFGAPLDGRPLMRGAVERSLRAAPPPAALRKRLGERLETGLAAFNTLLPIVRGQRIGLFAGSGVGKSSLLAKFARALSADVVVIALVGERGRELREFVETVLGPEGMARSVVVAATSDQSPLVRRRCAWAAMAVAEHFREQGQHVLFLADSVTRFAEAHREVALAAGESASLKGYPPSVSQQIMALAERAGPGLEGQGDITGIFSVLVPGSDMEEPVADILRGVLDGHVVLDRAIAERGRYPAVNLLRSVSRSLPHAASLPENQMIRQARAHLGAYDRAEMMIQAGLYSAGSDPQVDAAIRVWADLDAFIAMDEPENTEASFARLFEILSRASGDSG
ncbi:FliI/YscN family ATPase [Pseudothioclava arenosa]|uniref:Flagellum-specific ATP synthase FliI n=1 Tax=Pseudothioclava arenosa TaxID=1795308 RepID=A0A2A4CQJ8_9RHOB|nr:FliI/YscN family ATPase [Pseudothioclava arenosa]PCD76558.1 flagellum-specific ATP synthase FliI [Pseudothioclava arenosa]